MKFAGIFFFSFRSVHLPSIADRARSVYLRQGVSRTRENEKSEEGVVVKVERSDGAAR